MVATYFAIFSPLWWLLLLVMSVLMVLAVKAKSLSGASFVLLASLGIIIIFGDTMAYLDVLREPRRLVYGFGYYLVGAAVWGVSCWISSKWQAELEDVVVQSIFWPWAFVGAAFNKDFWLWKVFRTLYNWIRSWRSS